MKSKIRFCPYCGCTSLSKPVAMMRPNGATEGRRCESCFAAFGVFRALKPLRGLYCKRGHAIKGKNVKWDRDKTGKVRKCCRECYLAAQKAWHAKHAGSL